MTDVHPLQEWGISAGVPAGWTVAQKNGFYPSTGYRLASRVERVRAPGRRRPGLRHHGDDRGRLQPAHRHPADRGGRPPGGRGPHGRSRLRPVRSTAPGACSRAAASRGRASPRGSVSRAAAPASVRTTSGGNASPLSGQQACSPDIPGEPVSSDVRRSTAATAPSPPTSTATARDDLLWYGPGGAGDTRWAGHADRRFRPRSMSIAGDYIPIAGRLRRRRLRRRALVRARHAPDSVWSGGSGAVAWPGHAVNGLGLRASGGRLRRRRARRRALVPARLGRRLRLVRARRRRRLRRGRRVGHRRLRPGRRRPRRRRRRRRLLVRPRRRRRERCWRGQVGVRVVRAPWRAGSVAGAYRPVAGDGDGDGADEITWYAPGVARRLAVVGTAGRRPRSPPRRSTATTCRVAGDFDGDGRDDIAWYGPGGRPDWMWWGRADGGVTAGVMRRA